METRYIGNYKVTRSKSIFTSRNNVKIQKEDCVISESGDCFTGAKDENNERYYTAIARIACENGEPLRIMSSIPEDFSNENLKKLGFID